MGIVTLNEWRLSGLNRTIKMPKVGALNAYL